VEVLERIAVCNAICDVAWHGVEEVRRFTLLQERSVRSGLTGFEREADGHDEEERQ
jgi:hypothetical protein